MRRLTLALAVLFALLAPGAASAATQTVTFSELGLPQNTTVLDQYAGSPYLVSFGNPDRFGFPAPPPLLNCGSPYIQNNALNGNALGIACASGSNEFPDRRFATAMEFQNEQRTVSFNMVNRTPSQQTAVIRFYAIGSTTALTTLTHVLPPNQIDAVTYTAPDNRIIGAVIQGLEAMDYGDSGGVFIDDLAMSRDAQALTPKFTVAVQTPSAEAVEGSTVDVPVSVRRYNGSSGSVTLSVGSLPSKIESTQFLPNASATGTNPVTLRIRSKRPNTETQALSVNGSPVVGSAGTYSNAADPTVSVTGIPAIYFATGGRFPIRLVPGCGQQIIDDSFNVRGGFSGYTDYNFGGSLAASGLNVANTFSDSVPFPSGDGTYPFHYKLDPGSGDGSGSFTIHMQPLGATPADLQLNWISDRLSIDHVSDKAPALPLKEGGNTIRVIGNFPANCPVKFKDSLDQEWTVRSHDQTEVNGRLLDDYLLNMPSTAVLGPLRALNKAGVEMARTVDLDVREFRRSYGMNISNSTAGGSKGTYSWDDFERTFGDDDTDACFIVCVHDPVASDYYDQFKAKVEAGTGLCFGYATMSLRFRGYNSGQRFSDYQAGATRAWDIPVYGDSAIKRDIVRWYVAQFDKNFQTYRSRAASRSPAAEKTLLKDLINEQGGALIGIRQGNSGHAVAAYGVIDTGDGGMIIQTYDSNLPYQGFEQSSKTTRANALSGSQITVKPDGSFTGTGSVNYSGPNANLEVLENLPPVDAKLPSDFSLASVFSSTAGTPAAAAITGIETGGRPQLDSDGEPVDGGSVDLVPDFSGNGPVPQYELQKGRQYELTLKGSGKGSYDSSMLTGAATASVRSADTRKGQIDHLTIRPGEASLRFETGAGSAPVVYDLKHQTGKVTRTAAITTTAREGGEDEAELSGGTVRIAHDGAPATVSVALGAVGAGLPNSAQTTGLRVGRGQRLELTPRSWGSLAGGVRYALRTKSGRVLRSGNVALRGGGKVALGAVKAKRKGERLTVSGRVARRGSNPQIVAVATVVKGGKTLRRKSAGLSGAKVKKGRFSIPIAVGAVPKGARVKVDVVLLDLAGALSTARRSTVAR